MQHDEMRTLSAYTEWVNRRVLDTAAALPPEAFRAAQPGSLGSVRDLLVHILAVQQTWLARAEEVPVPPDLAPAEFPTVAALRPIWERSDESLCAFVLGLDAAALAHIVHYVNSRGEPNAYPRWQILWHQALHAAQHRGEVALLLTQSGHSPGWLDFLYYLDGQAAGDSATNGQE